MRTLCPPWYRRTLSPFPGCVAHPGPVRNRIQAPPLASCRNLRPQGCLSDEDSHGCGDSRQGGRVPQRKVLRSRSRSIHHFLSLMLDTIPLKTPENRRNTRVFAAKNEDKKDNNTTFSAESLIQGLTAEVPRFSHDLLGSKTSKRSKLSDNISQKRLALKIDDRPQ